MREDIQLIKQFEKYYREEVMQPFLRAVIDLIRSTGFKGYVIPRSFKKRLGVITKQWLKKYEKGLISIFDVSNGEVYYAWFEELKKQLPKQFRYKNSEYLIDEQKKRILKKTAGRWLVHVSLVKRATFEIWKYYEKDGLKLSDRIWKMAQQTAKDIQKQVMLSLQTGMSARRLRDQILKTAQQQPVEIPKWLQRQLKDADPDTIAKKVAQYIKKKQKYNAMRVARTEIQRAWRVSYVEQAKKLPFVKGIKWNLSESHPEEDICDELASADPIGLGPGVYPPDAVPHNGGPAHPQCLCYPTSVLAPLEEMIGDTGDNRISNNRVEERGIDSVIIDSVIRNLKTVPIKEKYTAAELKKIYPLIDPNNPRGLPKTIRNVKLSRGVAGRYARTPNFSIDEIKINPCTKDKLLTFIHESLHRQYATRANSTDWSELEEGVVDFLSKHIYLKSHPNAAPWISGYPKESLKLILKLKERGNIDEGAQLLFMKRYQGVNFARDDELKFLWEGLKLTDEDISFLFQFAQEHKKQVKETAEEIYRRALAEYFEINKQRAESLVNKYLETTKNHLDSEIDFKKLVKSQRTESYYLLQVLQYLLMH